MEKALDDLCAMVEEVRVRGLRSLRAERQLRAVRRQMKTLAADDTLHPLQRLLALRLKEFCSDMDEALP